MKTSVQSPDCVHTLNTYEQKRSKYALWPKVKQTKRQDLQVCADSDDRAEHRTTALHPSVQHHL